MQLQQAIPAVWVHTTNSAYSTYRAQGYGAFLTPQQQARLERIRQGRMLFDGRHYEYFKTEQRTQFDFPPTRAESRLLNMYVPFNLLGLISWKGADLLFGEEPLLRVDDDTQQKYLQMLVDRSSLHSLFYSKAVDASYEGEAFIEACLMDGQSYLADVPADEIFPIGAMRPDRQFDRYDRMALKNIGTDERPIWLLLKAIYLRGRIERHVYQVDDNGKLREVDLKNWPLDDGEAALEPVTTTGVDANTITWIPNQLVRGQPVSDYDGAVELQDELNAKQTQIARVLAQHADPVVALPRDLFDDQGNLRAAYKAFPFDNPDQIPKYIVWNAELQGAIEDRNFTRDALLIKTEMSPILLGIQTGTAHAQAFKTVRVQAYNSVTKAARKAAFWKNGIRRAIGIAMDMENALVLGVRYDRYPIGVDLRDGLPIDDLDQANRIAILLTAGAMSPERAVSEQLEDPAQAAVELAAIAKHRAAATPSILMQPPTSGGQEATTKAEGAVGT